MKLRPHLRRLRRVAGAAIAGGPLRGHLLTAALLHHLRARFRMAWFESDHPPHFTSFRYVAAEFALGDATASSFNRAFFTADLLRPADRLLDIGCGDGFADRRFYSHRCQYVDAIDIEPDAISTAKAHHAARNVTYHLADATTAPFPRGTYDIIVWDGAIGHFPPDTTELMLAKIRDALATDGVFTGSESLGTQEGAYDHLRFFNSLDDLVELLGGTFPNICVRELAYPLAGGIRRREAYWRCAMRPDRLSGEWVTAAPQGNVLIRT